VAEFKALFVYGIFKVIYSPFKAFKEISQNPRYVGPILIMILFIAANAGFVYTIVSKTYVEQTLPTGEQLDRWTENSTFWIKTADLAVDENYKDYINGTYYGNKSINFTRSNSTQISIQLDGTEHIDCAEPEGYKSLYLRIKQVAPEYKPENVTIYLFSTTTSDYFYYNLTQKLSNSTINEWNNVTIPLETGEWLNNGTNANWGDITGLKLEPIWLEDSNITLLVDGLFFGGVFRSPVENMVSYLFNFSLSSSMQFIIRWVLLGGIIYLITKAFKAKTVWRPLLILVGSALVTMFVQAAINVVVFSTLPTIYYPLELIGGVGGESEIAYNRILEETWLVDQVYRYVQMGVLVWTITLCAIASHLLAEFSWTKSFLVATVAYFATLLISSFILPY